MALHIYKSFCLVAENESISKAAKILHASQPTISAQIKSLEQQFDTPLLNRSNQGVKLTKAGEIVYEYAKKLLHLHDKLEKEIALLQSTENNCVIIGADRTVGNYVVPYLLSQFQQKEPTFTTKLKIMEHKQICERVLNKQLHIGIIDGPFQCCTLPPFIKCGQISNDKIHLVASPQLRKINNPLNIEDIQRIPLILPSKELKIREVIEQYLQENLHLSLEDLNIVCELNSIPAMKSYVFANYGAAFFCDLSIRRDLKANHLEIYEIEGLEMSMTYYYIYHRDCKTTELTKLVNFFEKKDRSIKERKKLSFQYPTI